MDDTQLGFSGFFFFLFGTCNVLIIFGVCGHAVINRATWTAPPEAEEAVASPDLNGEGGKSLQGAASTRRSPGSEASFY